jgi:hypothetical protein
MEETFLDKRILEKLTREGKSLAFMYEAMHMGMTHLHYSYIPHTIIRPLKQP